MSTTLPHVKEDLAAAEEAVIKAQENLIAALATRASKLSSAQMSELEATLEAAQRHRDDLKGTRDFIIERERLRGLSEVGTFSSVLYVSRRRGDFALEDVAAMASAALHKNESLGITGALYVFPEWFASYLEGGDRVLMKLMRSIERDPRHDSLRVVSRNLPGTTTARLFPRHGFAVRWCLDGAATQSTELWKALVPHLESQLHFTRFQPREPSVAKGIGSRSGRWYILHIAPSARFEDYCERLLTQEGGPQLAVNAFITVRRAAAAVVSGAHPGASTLTPLGGHVIAVVPADVSPDACVSLAMNLRQAIVEAEPAFFPHIALLLTKDVGEASVVADGSVTVAGPAMRRLRQLWTVGAQEDRPIVVDQFLAGELGDAATCVLAGWFDFDGAVQSVHVPAALSGDSPLATWSQFVDHQLRARIKASKKRHSIAASSAARSSTWGGATDDPVSSNIGRRRSSLTATGDVVPSREDPTSIVSHQSYATQPVVGGITEGQLVAAFAKCSPRARDNTISLGQLQLAIYDIDHMGHPPAVDEIVRQLQVMGVDFDSRNQQPSNDVDDPMQPCEVVESDGPRIRFEEFAVLYCRALLR